MSRESSQLLYLALDAAVRAGDQILKIYHSDEYRMEMKEDNSPVTDADRAAHRVISETLETSDIPVLSEEGKELSAEERQLWERFWLVDPLDGTKEFIRGNGEFTVNIALIEKKKAVIGVLYSPVLDLMYFNEPGSGAFRSKSFRDVFYDAADMTGIKEKAEILPLKTKSRNYRVVASRSHMNPETGDFIKSLKKKHKRVEIVSRGSALKFCMVAEGAAEIYPRFGPTWEWDTGAGQAIAEACGCAVKQVDNGRELEYNKDSLLNPFFILEAPQR